MTGKFSTDLTKAQIERLAYLSEECGELIQAIGKVLRHGYDSKNPDAVGHLGNRFDLENEAGDVLSGIKMLIDKGDINDARVGVRALRPKSEYFHHQKGG